MRTFEASLPHTMWLTAFTAAIPLPLSRAPHAAAVTAVETDAALPDRRASQAVSDQVLCLTCGSNQTHRQSQNGDGGQPDENINEPRYGAHVAEYRGDQIEVEQAD